MVFKSNVLTAPTAAVLILVLLQSACQASAIYVDVEESLEEESGVTKTGSGEAGVDNNVMSSGCHRVSKIVDFEEDLGWRFIVCPKSVDCVGYCNPLDPLSSTHQKLMGLLPNPREPCCVPSEYDSFDILYILCLTSCLLVK